jgi:Uma2 family endonuclease
MSRETASPTQRIGPRSAGISMTPEEFDAISDWDDLYRYELIRGVLVVSPIPSEAEGDPNEELGRLLRNYRADHPQGHSLDKTLAERYVLTTNRRRADRVIWAGLGRVPDPKRDLPTIIVEFVSYTKRDRRGDCEEKREEYLGVGIAEYWVVDRFARTLTVFQNGPAGVVERKIGESETYQTPILPGFELPLRALLSVADDWSESTDDEPTD